VTGGGRYIESSSWTNYCSRRCEKEGGLDKAERDARSAAETAAFNKRLSDGDPEAILIAIISFLVVAAVGGGLLFAVHNIMEFGVIPAAIIGLLGGGAAGGFIRVLLSTIGLTALGILAGLAGAYYFYTQGVGEEIVDWQRSTLLYNGTWHG